MLHSCDLENCEDTSATMVQKGEIYKKGRSYSMAGAPNDFGFKNNSYIPGISISSFLKDVGVSCNVVSLTLRTVFEVSLSLVPLRLIYMHILSSNCSLTSLLPEGYDSTHVCALVNSKSFRRAFCRKLSR